MRTIFLCVQRVKQQIEMRNDPLAVCGNLDAIARQAIGLAKGLFGYVISLEEEIRLVEEHKVRLVKQSVS